MQSVREKQCACYSLHRYYTLLRAKVRLYNMYLVFSITCPAERVFGRRRLVLFPNVLDIQSRNTRTIFDTRLLNGTRKPFGRGLLWTDAWPLMKNSIM